MKLPPFEDAILSKLSEAGLNLQGHGQFDHLAWMTYLSGDVTSSEARIVTLHEMWHHELNNVSTYGAALSAYAQLARHAKSRRDEYRQLLRGLTERARTAHEVYATWYSVELLAVEITREALLASHPLEYQEYYYEGAALVESLESSYLRQQAFLCALRSCFESTDLTERARNLDIFDLAEIRNREFPTSRLRLLQSILPPGFFEAELNLFLQEAAPEVARIVMSACSSPTPLARSGSAADEEDAATAELHRWFHCAIAKLFSNHGMASNSFQNHLQFIEETCLLLDKLCVTDDESYHRLIRNPEPLDNVTNLLIQAENEILYYRECPLLAVLYYLTDIPKDRHSMLVVGEPSHWFLCVRSAAQILAQHEIDTEQEKWLCTISEPLVFLRRRTIDSTGPRCELVVIQSPEELAQLRRLLPVPALASISSLSLTNRDWCDRWLPAIGTEFLCVTLFDLSLSKTLRDGWPEFKTIHYTKGTLSSGAVRKSFLTFLGIRTDKTCAVYVIPSTEILEGAVVSFIRQRLKDDRFIQDDVFLRDLCDVVPVVVQHILSEEYFFSLNQIQYESQVHRNRRQS
jgi:hypothetical protein